MDLILCHNTVSPSPADVVAPPPAPPFWELLTKAALQAEERGWHLCLERTVRDLLADKGGAGTK